MMHTVDLLSGIQHSACVIKTVSPIYHYVIEVIFNEMCYINLRFTYLLTYLICWLRNGAQCMSYGHVV